MSNKKELHLYELFLLFKFTNVQATVQDKINFYKTLIKENGNEELVQAICTTSVNLFRVLTIMLMPIVPGFTKNALEFLNEKELFWQDIDNPLLDYNVEDFRAIVTRIEDSQINKLLEN